MNKNDNNKDYESTLRRLEQIIELLERDDLELDRSMELYEEGASLYHKAKDMLSNQEEKAFKIIHTLEESDSELTIDGTKEEL